MKQYENAIDKIYNNKLNQKKAGKGNIIDSAVRIMNEKSPRERAHSERVCEICAKIGKAIGLDEDELARVKTMALLHDIGKIEIADEILNKKGQLNEQEYNEIKKHPEIGYRIIRADENLIEISESVLHHHERWDGKGYPTGLKGYKIPIFSRICAIADAFDAMTSDRSYRKAMSINDATDELKRCSGTQFDPEITKLFINKVLGKLSKQNDRSMGL